MKDMTTFSQLSRCWSGAATAPLCCPVWKRESGDGLSNTGSPPRWAWKAGVESHHPPLVSLSTLRTPYLDLTNSVDKHDPGSREGCEIDTQAQKEKKMWLKLQATDCYCCRGSVAWVAGRLCARGRKIIANWTHKWFLKLSKPLAVAIFRKRTGYR